jgi:hypothetical protein
MDEGRASCIAIGYGLVVIILALGIAGAAMWLTDSDYLAATIYIVISLWGVIAAGRLFKRLVGDPTFISWFHIPFWSLPTAPRRHAGPQLPINNMKRARMG